MIRGQFFLQTLVLSIVASIFFSACGSKDRSNHSEASSLEVAPGNADLEAMVNNKLLNQIRLNLVAEEITATAKTSKTGRSSQEVILGTLTDALVELNGLELSDEQRAAIRADLLLNFEKKLGKDWVLVIVRATQLPDDLAKLKSKVKDKSGLQMKGFLGELLEVLGVQGHRDFTIDVDLSWHRFALYGNYIY